MAATQSKTSTSKTTGKRKEPNVTPTDSAGEIQTPNTRAQDAKAAKEAAKEGDRVDDIQKAQEDSVRSEIDQHAAAVEANPVHPEEEIETSYLAGGEVPVNAPGTEGLERE